MAGREAERRAALDQALRDMMSAASELPAPESLLAFVKALEDLPIDVEAGPPDQPQR